MWPINKTVILLQRLSFDRRTNQVIPWLLHKKIQYWCWSCCLKLKSLGWIYWGWWDTEDWKFKMWKDYDMLDWERRNIKGVSVVVKWEFWEKLKGKYEKVVWDCPGLPFHPFCGIHLSQYSHFTTATGHRKDLKLILTTENVGVRFASH